MTSYHVTSLSHAFFIVLPKYNKVKEKRSKIRKIKENKIKIVSVQASHNTPTVRANIKWTQTYVLFGDIDSTEIGTKRNTSRSMKIESN